jgi:hypothetical protein
MTLPPFDALRRSLLLAGIALLFSGPTHAVGGTVDVQVVERDTGATLPVYHHRGAQYVPGRPGARYAIRVSNRSGQRVLAVMSVDGVNIVSGQTAAWNQGGYVLGPWQTHEITGWRKSPHEVAAFEFTALPDSYAARTGRPADVGVIGVAVFTERPVHVRPAPARSWDEQRGRFDADAGVGGNSARAEKAAPSAAAPAPSQDAAGAVARRAPQEAESRLGTGHGAREASYSSTTQFVRASSRPHELVSIRYDRHENLVRTGVIADEWPAQPRPFPRSRAQGFVPDPPVW